MWRIDTFPRSLGRDSAGHQCEGSFLGTKHAIAHLRLAGGGSIINLSSIYGLVSAPDLPPHHASKGVCV
jgi:NAD(P)-dependent dehydrogenase (short-subunit alcohol dehydrogenase family)